MNAAHATKLERLFLEMRRLGGAWLMLEWDNGRHHSFAIDRRDPDSVKQALLAAANLIGQEQNSKKL